MKEWKKITGYSNYEINEKGQVRNSSTRQVIKPTENYCGYLRVGLRKAGKSRTILLHRLVAISFIENQNELPEVNHIDGNKLNNHVSNLQWCTRNQNMAHASESGLLKVRKSRGPISESDARLIRGLCLQGVTAKKIAERFNCSLQSVYNIGGKKRSITKINY